MVIPVDHYSFAEINFLKNHPFGPSLSVTEIAKYLGIPEKHVQVVLQDGEGADYGGYTQEISFLFNHPLCTTYSSVLNSTKKGVYLILSFLLWLIFRIGKFLLTLLYRALKTTGRCYLEMSIEAADFMCGGLSKFFGLKTGGSDIDESWFESDSAEFQGYNDPEDIARWKAEFAEIFPESDIVEEIYDYAMTIEKHRINMILINLDCRFTQPFERPETISYIRAKYYRDWFVKVFPVQMDDFLLDMVYTAELTLEQHVAMMRLAIRTKYGY